VPTSTSVACIGSGKKVKVTEGTNQTGVVQGEGTLAISSGSLEVANALEASHIASLEDNWVLDVVGTVDVTASLSMRGEVKGAGSLVLESGATGSMVGAGECTMQPTFREATFVNDGTLTFGSHAAVPEGAIALEEGAKFENAGTFYLDSYRANCGGGDGGTSIAVFGSGPAPTFTNTGTVDVNLAEREGSVEVAFVNDGTVNVQQGVLPLLNGGSSSKGVWTAASGTKVVFGGSFSQSEGEWSGAGGFEVFGSVTASHLNVTHADVTVGSQEGDLVVPAGTTLSLPSLVEDGKLAVAGEVDVSTSLTLLGKIQGAGTLVLESGGSAAMAPTGACLIMVIDEATFVNDGTVTFGPSGGASDGDIAMENGAQFDNAGTVNLNSNVGESCVGYRRSIANLGGTTPTFTNTGTLHVELGEGREGYVEVDFANYGSLMTTSGKLIIEHPVFTRESSSQYGGSENPSTPGEPHAICGKPVSCATGNESESQTDFAIGGRGVGLDLTRTYNSQAAAEGTKGVFGYGWSSSFSDHLVVNKTSKITTLYQAGGSTVPFMEEAGGAFKAPVWTQDTLSGTEGTGYTLTLAGQVKYKFAGASGRLESVTDRDGNATTLTYNEGGQLTTVTDPASRTIKLTYNGEGLVESAEDPMKHVVKYTYEGGNLKSVTQPAEAGLRWQFKYESHEMTEMVDGREGKTTNEYNGSHQVVKQKDPAGHTLKFEYEPFHTKITNETTGSATNEYFTSNDEPASITRGFGTASATTESFMYNVAGLPLSTTDGNGHTTTYGYDSSNNRTSMIDPNKNETKWTYDSTHDVETMTTPKGEVTTIKREAHGNPETIERPAPESKTQTTKYKYTAHGELESVEDPLKRVWKYEYDAKGDRTAELDALTTANKRTWEYNEDSQEIATVSPRGNVAGGKPAEFTTKIERDAQGRPLTVTDPLKHTTKYTYDGDGNVETVTDGNGHKTKYTYNGDNEPIKVEAPSKAVTETEYDGAGQVIKQIDGNKHTTKYVRNVLEQVTEVEDPLKHKTLKEYDSAGNLVKLTDPKSRTTTYTYNPANRLEEVGYSSGKPAAVKYEYDKDGDRTKMVDGTGTSKYTYDQLDRLTESENGNKEVIKYEYDLANDQTKITYPNKKAVTRAFDKDGRLEKVTDWLTHATKFSYNPDSELNLITFPTETKNEDKYAYNDADQMTEVKMLKSTETLASLVYTRDSDGQVKKTTSKGLPGVEVTEGTYDENNRLTKYGATEYKYDAANNPTKEGSSTNTFNEGAELEKGTGVTYAYDELGERTKRTPETGAATTYGYDQAGSLTSVERPEKEAVPKIEDSYAYNGGGLRTSQTINGTTSYFAWDVTEGIPQILSDGTNSYIYGPGGVPIEQINASETPSYLHHDQQGSIRLLTGSAGTTTGSITFDAYGNKVESTGTISPLGYDGQYTSTDTGLIYLRARVYDPSTAQFLTRDPLAAISGEPYSYAEDNPLTLVDPSGLLSLEEVGEAIAGWGDTLTFGATKWAREELGDNNVDECSTAYQTGGYGGLATAVLIPGEGEVDLGGNLLSRIGTRLADETGAIGRYGNLGNLAERADETVADVIRSRGGGASQVNQLQTGYGQLTLGEISDLAAQGDPEAVRAIKMVKQAGSQGKGGK
jgi:RHS repeat-associated protein